MTCTWVNEREKAVLTLAKQWVDANEQRLAKDKLIHRSKGGKKGLLLNQLQQFGDLFGFDVETVATPAKELFCLAQPIMVRPSKAMG